MQRGYLSQQGKEPTVPTTGGRAFLGEGTATAGEELVGNRAFWLLDGECDVKHSTGEGAATSAENSVGRRWRRKTLLLSRK